MTLADEKYVSVATFRRSGDAVATATWIVPLDGGRMGFWTSSGSGKVKRLRNNPAVTVQPSDSRGRVKAGTTAVTGVAAVVDAGVDFEAIQQKVRAKYGAMVPITRVLNTLGHLGRGKEPYGDLAVVITPTS